jgi:hypothetical protein
VLNRTTHATNECVQHVSLHAPHMHSTDQQTVTLIYCMTCMCIRIVQVGELLRHTQSVYSIEYMTLLDADHHILASLGMNSRVGEVFNPENILNAAANVTIDDDSVWLSGILTYTDLMKETPPLYFDRESQRDMAMKV